MSDDHTPTTRFVKSRSTWECRCSCGAWEAIARGSEKSPRSFAADHEIHLALNARLNIPARAA